MANNKVSSLFNVDLPKPKRSNFNLGRVNRFTADIGWTIPCYTEEILPHSYKRLDLEALIQTNATVAPLMGSFKVKVDAFFVPRRLYHQHLDLNNIRPNFSDNFDYHYFLVKGTPETVDASDNHVAFGSLPLNSQPQPFTLTIDNIPPSVGVTSRTNLSVAPSSLLDYLGLLPVGFSHSQWRSGSNLKLDALPFIGYYDIFRNYYANPHDQLVPFRIRNYSDGVLGTGSSDVAVDRYVDLSMFDDFIRKITLGSLSSSGNPVAVDVVDVFGSCFRFTSDVPEFYNYPPLFAGQAVSTGTSLINGKFLLADTRDGRHFGLLRRTYMDDYFNSRFMNSFVTYMEETATVDVRDNQFNISQLRLANRIAKYVDKSIFSDTRFGSWLKAHFGVKTNQKLCIPQFLGSITSSIQFNDIASTAQTGGGDITSNQALGSRASLGQGYIKNKGSFVEFQASEPGVLMCIFSIIPYTSYFQGIKKMYLKTNFYDMFRPEFDAVGYDDLQKLEFSAVPNYIPVFGSVLNLPSYTFSNYNVSIGKHPAWVEYMTSYDECHGLMTKRDEFGYWLLNRPFSPYSYDPQYYEQQASENILLNYPDAFDSSTYINPEYFNTIFAVNKFTDNFQVQIRFYDKTKQPISKQILPHL